MATFNKPKHVLRPQQNRASIFRTFLMLFFSSFIFISPKLMAQVAPVNPPSGGFAIDGGLKANTPTSPLPFAANQGDWVSGTGGTGGSVLSNTGVPVDATTTGLKTDLYNNGSDEIFTTGSKFNDYISSLAWTASTAPNKNDINNAMYHVSKDGSNNQWIMIAGDRLSTSGTSYIDFEFLQGTLTKNAGGTFTGSGPAGGRTVGDLVISMEYTNGGAIANVLFYQWKLVGSTYQFVQFTPSSNTAYARTNAGNEDVPFGAFGATVYQPFAFVEAAINITSLLTQTGDACAGLSVKTLWIKTKASASSTAALKDFVNPIPVSFTFGSASISYNTPFCQAAGTTASPTQTGTTGGTYTASPSGLSINSSTGVIDLGASTPGTYTVTYTFTTSGCTKKATASVVINPTPTVSVNSPVKCANDPAVTITATPTPAASATNVYSYAWTVPAGANPPGNVASFSTTVGGGYSVIATLAGCSGNGSGTLTVNPNPTITSPAIANVCAGATSALVSYSGLTGSPNQYRIDWDATANTAGLADIILTTLPASPFNIAIPGTVAPGTYNGTIYVKNSTFGCESTGGAISLTVNGNPTASAGTAPAAQCADAVNGNTFNLSGSGTNGTPSWSVQSASPNTLNAVITNGNTFSPSVKVTGGSGTVTLRLTVTSSSTPSCGSQISDVTVTVNANATASAGIAPTAQCLDAANGNTFQLNGTATNGTPKWTVFSKSPNTLTAVISNDAITNPTVKVTGGSGTVTLRLTVNSTTVPSCGNPTSDVTVTVNPLPTANAGTDPAAQCYAASGNTFNLTGSGTNGTPSWTVQNNPTNATVVITNGNTLSPSVKVTAGTNGGTVTLRLTITSDATPACGSAFDDIDLAVSKQVAGPSVSILPVTCTDKTFSLQVDNPQSGTTYTLTQPGNTRTFTPIVYNGVDPVIFTGLTFGDGGTVVASQGSCSSAPGSCDPGTLSITKVSQTQPTMNETASVTKVTAAPNPFNDRIRFTITPGTSGRGSLDLYNLLGQKVKTVFEGQVQKGQLQTIEYYVPNSQRSFLIYQFHVGTQNASGKLVGLK